MTIVASGGSTSGEQRITRLAPASRRRSISARVRYCRVASITMSTPRSPQGISPPASPGSLLIWRPATWRAPSGALPPARRRDRAPPPQLAPGDPPASLPRQHLDLAPGHVEIPVARAHLVRKPAEDGVEAQQVHQAIQVGHVADRLDPDIVAVIEDAEDVPPDASQTHQPDAGRHSTTPLPYSPVRRPRPAAENVHPQPYHVPCHRVGRSPEPSGTDELAPTATNGHGL